MLLRLNVRKQAVMHAKFRSLGLVLLTVFLFMGNALWAQTLSVDAPSTVIEGQPFKVRYTFSYSSQPSKFREPDWGPSIKRIAGPYTEQSQSISVVNGSMSRKTYYSWTFVCRADKDGTLTIKPASAFVDDEEIKSTVAEIEVLKSDDPAAPQAQQQSRARQSPGSPGGQAPTSSNTRGDNSGRAGANDLLVRVVLSRTEAYVGQPIVATLKIYTTLELLGFEDVQFPDFKGFWAKELPSSGQISFTTEAYQGREYNVGILRQYVLFPQKSGENVIDPLTVSAQYRVRVAQRDFFDAFMGAYQTDTKTVSSSKIKLKILPLPPGKPASFNGAVGQFQAESSIDKQDILTNEAVTYRLTVNGTGNLQLISKPDLEFPTTVEVFPPKLIENYNLTGSGQKGSVTYEYVLIPRAPGQIALPTFDFSYFDPSSASYKVAKTNSYTLNVTADTLTREGNTVATGLNREEVKYLGKDIRHISVVRPNFRPKNRFFIGSWLWWLVLALLLASYILAYVLLRRRQKRLANVELVRGRKARGVAKKRLKRAKILMEKRSDDFYEELQRATWGYLADKLTLNLADLSSDSVREQLLAKHVPEDVVKSLSDVISECEFARYSPSSDRVSKQMDLYSRAAESIDEVDSWLKSKRRTARK